MSRIGKMVIPLPKNVEVKQEAGRVTVKGPKGSLATPMSPGITVVVENNEIKLSRADEEQRSRAQHGLMRALVANNVRGVSEGFTRTLDIVGVGYRGEVKGREVVFQLGYSHPVRFPIPEGIEMTVDAKSGRIVVTGIDKQKVGQVAAEVRSLRKPDSYKGKGIKYTDEVLRIKPGKAAGK